MIFYLFTKTNWDEPPRIRHQLAHLLIKNNHEVFFFQKPKQNFSTKTKAKSLKGITLLRYSEFLHHQLRPGKYTQIVNGLFCKKNIRKAIKDLPLPDVIINFNYDDDLERFWGKETQTRISRQRREQKGVKYFPCCNSSFSEEDKK